YGPQCVSVGSVVSLPVRTTCTPSRRPAGPLAPPTRQAQPGHRFAQARLARRQSRGNPGQSPGRSGFDPGTPRGGSVGLMRATWEGRPIAGQRTAPPPASNPQLCRYGTDGPLADADPGEAASTTVKEPLTVALGVSAIDISCREVT